MTSPFWDKLSDEQKALVKGKKLALYARVSTREQKVEGTIENQIAGLKEFGDSAVKLGRAKSYQIFTDNGVSGSTPFDDRKGGTQLLETVKRSRKGTWLAVSRDLKRWARNQGYGWEAIAVLSKRQGGLLDLDLGGSPKYLTADVKGASTDKNANLLGGIGLAMNEREVLDTTAASIEGRRQAALVGKWDGVPQPLYDWDSIFNDFFTGTGKNGKPFRNEKTGRITYGLASELYKKWGEGKAIDNETFYRQLDRFLALQEVGEEDDWLNLYDELRKARRHYGPRGNEGQISKGKASGVQTYLRAYTERYLKDPLGALSELPAVNIPALEAAARLENKLESEATKPLFYSQMESPPEISLT